MRRCTLILAVTLALLVMTVGTTSADPAGGGIAEVGRQARWLTSGEAHTCVVQSGQVRCWGFGTFGRLGYGNTTTIGDGVGPAVSAVGPVDLGPGRTAVAVAANYQHTCAILDDGTVRCWGAGSVGRLGYGNTTNVGDGIGPAVSAVGPVDLGPGRTAVAITAGLSHTCAILDDGTVRCWGSGAVGKLGYGNTTTVGNGVGPDVANVGPVDLGAGRTAASITAGANHTCAILDDGTVRCWGLATLGRLGYGNTTTVGDDETPGSIGTVNLGTGRTAVAITAGTAHTCAVLDDGTVRCWGLGDHGQLGYGNTDRIGDDETPGSVGPVDLGTGRTAIAITAGIVHTCAILDDGTVRCWGQGDHGQLGYGNTNDVGDGVGAAVSAAGAVDLGTGRTAVAITAGDHFTCARLDDGAIRCWGQNDEGQLGNDDIVTIGDGEPPSAAGPSSVGGTALTPPSPVTAVGATAGATAATVTWTAPATPGTNAITGYRVAVSPTTGVTGASSRTAAAGETSFDFGGLTDGTAYTFSVRAISAAGASRGGRSSAVTPATPTTTTTTTSPTTSPPLPTTTTVAATTTTTTLPPAPTARRAAPTSLGVVSVDPAGRPTTHPAIDPTIVLSDGTASWSVDRAGAVTVTGLARYAGDRSRQRDAPIIALAITPDLRGYWLVGSDGGVFTFGTARFYGSLGARRLEAPVVDVVATTTGRGYWLVDARGGVHAFGDAADVGGRAGRPLAAPIVGMAPTRSGRGYWLLGGDGGVFTYGDATFHGSTVPAGRRAVLLVPSDRGRGYWIVDDTAAVHAFGDVKGL